MPDDLKLPNHRDQSERLREEIRDALVRFIRELRVVDIAGYVTLKGACQSGKPVGLNFMWGSFTLKGSETKELFERAESLNG